MQKSQSDFDAPWSPLLIAVSAGSSMLLVGVMFAVWAGLKSKLPTVAWVGVAATPVLLLSTACFTIRGYRIDKGALLVRRLFWYTRIPLSGLRDARAEPDVFRKAFRVFGNGGMFSISGWYWSRRLGLFRAYVTDQRHTVLLTFKDRKIVLSPANADAFIQALEPRLGRTRQDLCR